MPAPPPLPPKPLMLWFEITAHVPPPLVDAVAAVMRDVSPGGVTIEEPVDILGPERGFRVRESEPVLVRAYLPSSELGAVLTEDLRRAMEAFPEVELIAKPLYEQDWAVSWREFFGIVDNGGRILVVPSWIEHEAKPDQLIIRLDPGQAFGTGHHETTRLCLAALEKQIKAGDRVLDVGTGSGILSIAAVLLGCGGVHAFDIDPVAVEVAHANFAINGVGARITATTGRLDESHSEGYDVVVSNISTEANIALAPHFGRVVRPGGRLILSGILSVDGAQVRAAADAEGLTPTEMHEERDWCLLEFTRRP